MATFYREKSMRFIFIVAAALALTPVHAQRNRQPEVASEALKAMQVHEVTGQVDRVFLAIVSAITDKNYTVETASKDAGLITATENTKSKMGGVGLTTGQNTIKLSITVVSVGDGRSRIRINAIDNYVYTYMGRKYRDENQPVTNVEIYKELFAAIDSVLS